MLEVGLGLAKEDSQSKSEKIAVHKFGGSSLSSVQRLNNVIDIVRQQTSHHDIIVVSANGAITDWLVEYLAAGSDNAKQQILSKLRDYYQSLFDPAELAFSEVLAFFELSLQQLENNQLNHNQVLALGEVWSAQLLTQCLNNANISAIFVDARDVLRTSSIKQHKAFDLEYFSQGLKRVRYGNFAKRVVITGYIALNEHNQSITLGRNGSDYSATIIGNLACANEVVLWTDVCGIFNADPRLIKDAFSLDSLSYLEASRLASIGTNVLHQKSISPLVEKRIVLSVKSSLHPQQRGSKVGGYESTGQSQSSLNRTKSIALKAGQVKFEILSKAYNENAALLDELFEQNISCVKVHAKDKVNQFALFVTENQQQLTANILLKSHYEFSSSEEIYSLVSIISAESADLNLVANSLLNEISDFAGAKVLIDELSGVVHIESHRSNQQELLNSVYSACFHKHHKIKHESKGYPVNTTIEEAVA